MRLINDYKENDIETQKKVHINSDPGIMQQKLKGINTCKVEWMETWIHGLMDAVKTKTRHGRPGGWGQDFDTTTVHHIATTHSQLQVN